MPRDPETIGKVVTPYEAEVAGLMRRLYRYALVVTRNNHADAEDVVQDTLLKLLTHKERDERKATLFTFACIVLRHQWYKTINRRIRREAPIDIESAILIPDGTVNRDAKDDLLDALRVMDAAPVQYQKVMTEIALNDDNKREVAAKLGVSEKTVYNYRRSVRDLLATKFRVTEARASP